MSVRPLLLLGAWLALAGAGWGHEELERQIRLLGERIAANPGDAELLLRRADAYRRHREWDRALADYRDAGRAGGDAAVIALGRAQLELDRDAPEEALDRVRPLVDRQPDHAAARLVEARAWAALGRPEEALRAWDRALGLLRRPQPDHYLERARLRAGAGSLPDPRAIEELDAGTRRLGDPVSLHRQALAWERQLGRHDAALVRCDRVLALHPGNLPWMIARAGVLEEAGRRVEAREAWTAADRALRRLPARRARTAAAGEWRKAVAAGLSSSLPLPAGD